MVFALWNIYSLVKLSRGRSKYQLTQALQTDQHPTRACDLLLEYHFPNLRNDLKLPLYKESAKT